MSISVYDLGHRWYGSKLGTSSIRGIGKAGLWLTVIWTSFKSRASSWAFAKSKISFWQRVCCSLNTFKDTLRLSRWVVRLDSPKKGEDVEEGVEGCPAGAVLLPDGFSISCVLYLSDFLKCAWQNMNGNFREEKIEVQWLWIPQAANPSYSPMARQDVNKDDAQPCQNVSSRSIEHTFQISIYKSVHSAS